MLATPSLIISPLNSIDSCFHSLLPCKEKERRGKPKTNQKNFYTIIFFQRRRPCFRCPIAKLLPPRCSRQNLGVSSLHCSLDQPVELATIALLLKSCSSLVSVKAVHSISMRCFGFSITFLNNNLISVYARFFDIASAKKLFDVMPERSVVSWTALLNGYMKAGMEEDALLLYERLINSNILANSLTFVCALKLSGKRLDFVLGRQIHACVIKGNWSNLFVDSALLYFYSKCGDLNSATAVFDHMLVRDVICWTAMISAYAQHGHENEALSMFSQMQCHGFSPNEFTICSALKACGELKALSFGRQLHGIVTKGIFNRDLFIESSLVGMYVKCKKVLDARSVFDHMPKRNTVTWTTMISGYSLNGYGEEAIDLLKSMKKKRIRINNRTIVSLIGACTSIPSLDLGKEAHGQIVKNTSQRDTYVGSALISFYCKCGKYEYAARVLETMPARDCISWTAMITGYAKHGQGFEALRFLNGMLREGLEPTPFTYSSALKACTKLKAVNYGRWIHSSVNKALILPNVYVGSALIGMYMQCGCITDAFRVFDMMPERNRISWKVMVLGYVKNGQCDEAMKLMYRMKAEGFHVNEFILTAVLSSCGDFVGRLDCSSTNSLSHSLQLER